MKLGSTKIKDLYLISPKLFKDNRGYFFESFNLESFKKKINKNYNFVQDNESLSKKNVLRGLHFQKPPYEQAKLVRVLNGSIFDVAVDIRPQSPTYKKWYGVVLSSNNNKQLFIPEGFAHGFLSLEDDTKILYKTTNYFNKDSERSILWNDSEISIEWPTSIDNLIISDKDKFAQSFREHENEIFRNE